MRVMVLIVFPPETWLLINKYVMNPDPDTNKPCYATGHLH